VITIFGYLKTVEVEKRNKYGLLVNHCGALYDYKTKLVSYAMT